MPNFGAPDEFGNYPHYLMDEAVKFGLVHRHFTGSVATLQFNLTASVRSTTKSTTFLPPDGRLVRMRRRSCYAGGAGGLAGQPASIGPAA